MARDEAGESGHRPASLRCRCRDAMTDRERRSVHSHPPDVGSILHRSRVQLPLNRGPRAVTWTGKVITNRE